MDRKKSAEEILSEIRAKRNEQKKEIEKEYNRLGRKLEEEKVPRVEQAEDQPDSRAFIESYFSSHQRTEEDREREQEGLRRLHEMLMAGREEVLREEEEEATAAEETEEEYDEVPQPEEPVIVQEDFSLQIPRIDSAAEDHQPDSPVVPTTEAEKFLREKTKPAEERNEGAAEPQDHPAVSEKKEKILPEQSEARQTEEESKTNSPQRPHVQFQVFEPMKKPSRSEPAAARETDMDQERSAVPEQREEILQPEEAVPEMTEPEEVPSVQAESDIGLEADTDVLQDEPESASEGTADPEQKDSIAEAIAAAVEEKSRDLGEEPKDEEISEPEPEKQPGILKRFWGRRTNRRDLVPEGKLDDEPAELEEPRQEQIPLLSEPISDRDDEEDDSYPQDEESMAWIGRKKAGGVVRTCLLGVLMILAALLTFLQGSALLPGVLQASTQPAVYLVCNVILLGAGMILAVPYLVDGIRNLMGGHPGCDSVIAVPVLLLFFLTCISGLDLKGIGAGTIQLYTAPPLAALFFTALAHLLWACWVKRELTYLQSAEQKQILSLTDRENVLREASRTVEFAVEEIGIQRQWTNQKNLVRRFDVFKAPQKIYGVTAVLQIVISILTAAAIWLTTGSPVNGMAAGAALLAVSMPCAYSVGTVLAARRESRRLRRYGTVLTGIGQLQNVWNMDVLVCRDKDICPPGSVGLVTIKTFGDGRIDEVIIYAASICKTAENGIWPLFDQIIQSNHKLLLPVESFRCDPDSGVECFIGSKRISMGTREQLARCGMDVPSRDFEEKYCAPGCFAMYLAVSGEIKAMFVLEYVVPDQVREHLAPVFANGIMLAVDSADPNLTAERLQTLLQVDPEDVTVLSTLLREKLAGVGSDEQAPVIHKGSFMSLLAGVRGCGHLLRTLALGRTLQTIGSIVGLLLAAVSCITFGGAQLGGIFALLYTLGWTGLILILQSLS